MSYINNDLSGEQIGQKYKFFLKENSSVTVDSVPLQKISYLNTCINTKQAECLSMRKSIMFSTTTARRQVVLAT